MKIREIRAAKVNNPESILENQTIIESVSGHQTAKNLNDRWDWANPMSKYPRFKADRILWQLPLDQVACVITADDGCLVPNDLPGLGLEITIKELESAIS